MKHLFPIIAVGLLAVVSCDNSVQMPDPGAIYEITFPDGSGTGVAIFKADGDQMVGTFYADNGTLYADADNVSLVTQRRKLKMRFPEGDDKKFTFKKYIAPTYPDPELKEVLPYRDSIYSVEKEPEEVRYGNAKGYWTSYPRECGKSFTDIYKARYGMVIDGTEDCSLTMDIYKPIGAGVDPRPLFLMIHGGAFFYEDKADPEYAAWCRYFASLGYVAASMNYRMGFDLRKGEIQRAGYRALQDANAAIRYLLVHRKDLHINPNLVFLAGNSAGAMTALNLAFLEEDAKPVSAKGGRVLEKINNLLNTSIKDLGAIDAINPSDSANFTIKAIANMWGAVLDPTILESNKVAIVSFHSENDPTVDVGYDYPFRDYIQEELFDFIKWPFLANTLNYFQLKEKANQLLFEKMYGSRYIHQKAKDLGYHSVFYKYPDERHSLHIDDNGLPLHFHEIEHRMADFFSHEMEEYPINLHLDEEDNRWARIDKQNVKHCYWKVKGGVIRETADGGIRVLLFRDAKDRSVTVHGDYNSRTTFKETLPL